MSCSVFRRPSARRRLVLAAVFSAVACAPATAQTPTLGARTFSIGSIDDPDQSFENITGLVPMLDGGVIVADGGSGTLRFYDASGTLIREAGGVGGGPGEYQQLAGLYRDAEGGLVAFDFNGSRVSILDAGGVFETSFVLNPPPGLAGRAELAGVLSTGALAVHVFRAGGDGAPDGYQLWIYDRMGTPMERVATLPGRLVGADASGGPRLEIILPWGSMPAAVAAGTRVWYGHGSEYRLRSGVGGSADVTPDAPRPPAVTDAVVDDFIDALVATLPQEDRALVRRGMGPMREAPRPEHLPYFSGLVPDGDGVWSARFHVPGTDTRQWDLFDADGRSRGSLVTSADIDVRVVDGPVVWAVRTDALGVQFVDRYVLHR